MRGFTGRIDGRPILVLAALAGKRGPQALKPWLPEAPERKRSACVGFDTLFRTHASLNDRSHPAAQTFANRRMWFIQTPVETLALPTDSVGRTTLTGTVGAWQHLVRDNTFGADERASISAMPMRWSIWAWQQTGRRVLVHDTIAMHEPLADMVRAEPFRVCLYARYPEPGKRQSDNTLELIVVVPPEQFERYEALVQFAMTLPAGHVSMTIPSPAVPPVELGTIAEPVIITPGTYSLMEGLEMVVARSNAEILSIADLRSERRRRAAARGPAHLLPDDGDDWLLFASESIAETTSEPVVSEQQRAKAQ